MQQIHKIIWKIHLWLGLSCGVIASFSGLTGALYVWQPEITSLLNPKLLKVENFSKINEKTILSSAYFLATQNEGEVSKVFLPYREQQTISINYKDRKTLYYHPETRVFLGEKSMSIQFFETLLKLHRTLGIPTIGKYIMGTSTLLFCFFLLTTGFYMWWKAYKNNLSKGFTMKWKPKKKRFYFNLHKIFGIYFLLPLLVIALTGGYFTYYKTYKSALSIFNNSDKIVLDEEAKQEKIFSLEEAILQTDGKYALRAIYYPKDSLGVYKLRYIKDRFIEAGFRKTKEMELNPQGKLRTLSSFDFDSNNNRIAAQFYPIHIGEIAGILGRFLVFFSGLVPLVLLITGFKVYSAKRKRLKK
ncbi:PepSY-associated TM helix domain-containing protein [Tenacibaculum ascidiaceicola]|uniref:PepSY-associated TM helix domain-containing protein n=1 Tax=Tenacibaculum ascidiaceicola TaxID=1699411 RepID=UPI0039E7D7BA